MTQKRTKRNLSLAIILLAFCVLNIYNVSAYYSIEYRSMTLDKSGIVIEGQTTNTLEIEIGDELRLTIEVLDNLTHVITLREAPSYNVTLEGFDSFEMIFVMNFDSLTTLHFDISNCDETLEVLVLEYVAPSFWDDQALLTLLGTIALCVIIIGVTSTILLLRKRREKKFEKEEHKDMDGKPIPKYYFGGYREIDPVLLRELKKMRELKGKPADEGEISTVLDLSVEVYKQQIEAKARPALTVADEMKFIIATNRQLVAQNKHLAGRVRDLEIEVEGFHRRMEKMGDSILVAGAIDLTNKPLNWNTGFKRIWEKYKFIFIALIAFVVLIIIFLALSLTGQFNAETLPTS